MKSSYDGFLVMADFGRENLRPVHFPREGAQGGEFFMVLAAVEGKARCHFLRQRLRTETWA